jgi:hypothetical protein
MFQRVYYGPVTNEENAELPDLRGHEWASVVPLCATALVMGIFPAIFLTPMEPSVAKLVQRVQATQNLRVQSGGPAESTRPLTPVSPVGSLESVAHRAAHSAIRGGTARAARVAGWESPESLEGPERSERSER